MDACRFDRAIENGSVLVGPLMSAFAGKGLFGKLIEPKSAATQIKDIGVRFHLILEGRNHVIEALFAFFLHLQQSRFTHDAQMF